MGLLFLGSRDIIIRKNNYRMDFEEIWKEKEIEYSMNRIINIYIYIP